MKYIAFLLFCCLSTVSYSIDIVINSVGLDMNMDATDCLDAANEPSFDITISNAINDGGIPSGDLIGGVVRDANCNVMAWWYNRVSDGNEVVEVGGIYEFMTTFPPDSRPFVISFHDLTSEVGLDGILATPPITSMVFDPTLSRPDCNVLADLGDNTCPFAEVTIVPTLGEWALIILAIMMMIFGVLYIEQREVKIQPSKV